MPTSRASLVISFESCLFLFCKFSCAVIVDSFALSKHQLLFFQWVFVSSCLPNNLKTHRIVKVLCRVFKIFYIIDGKFCFTTRIAGLTRRKFFNTNWTALCNTNCLGNCFTAMWGKLMVYFRNLLLACLLYTSPSPRD